MLDRYLVGYKNTENPARFSTSYTGVWGIPKRFKGVKGWVSGIGYEWKSQSPSSCPGDWE